MGRTYFIFYRFYALVNWWSFAKKDEPLDMEEILSNEIFDEINIICPNDEKILQFQNSMKPTLQIILKNQIQIQSLTKTRDALLPKLMSGEIRV